MALTAVRLRPVDKRKNWGMRTYVSANSRTKYTSGDEAHPSPFRVVTSQKEIAELQSFDQFEVLEFDDMEHLKEFIQQEMEQRARVGLPAVRAAVMSGAGKTLNEVAPPRKAPAAARLPAAASGPAHAPASDPTKTNTGRQPASAKAAESNETARQPAEAAKPVPKAGSTASPASKPSKAASRKDKKRSTRPATDE